MGQKQFITQYPIKIKLTIYNSVYALKGGLLYVTNSYFLSTSFLMIASLCFTMSFAKRNIFLNKTKTKFYIYATITNIALLILQSAEILLACASFPYAWVLRVITNFLGFALCPAIPFLLHLLNFSYNKKQMFLLSIPLFFNIIACLISIKTGFIFFVDSMNQYSRGAWFLLSLGISAFYFLILIIMIPKNSPSEFSRNEKRFLLYVSVIIILCVIIQVLACEMFLIWHSCAMGLILYYIFLHETHSKFDPLTGILNRAAFMKELEMIQNNRNVAFVAFDLNGLKQINDCNGHASGDTAIIIAAKCIKNSFKNLGNSYRIGGDEFIAICDNATGRMIEACLVKLNKALNQTKFEEPLQIELASGYSFYQKNSGINIHTILEEADNAMYASKAKIKYD